MHALLTAYFDNVTFAQFAQDLREKIWVVLLRDGTTGAIKGLSTFMQLRVCVDDRLVVAFFLENTNVEQAYWGEDDAPVYGFLISSGYKTYRFLFVFFTEVLPLARAPDPSSHPAHH